MWELQSSYLYFHVVSILHQILQNIAMLFLPHWTFRNFKAKSLASSWPFNGHMVFGISTFFKSMKNWIFNFEVQSCLHHICPVLIWMSRVVNILRNVLPNISNTLKYKNTTNTVSFTMRYFILMENDYCYYFLFFKIVALLFIFYVLIFVFAYNVCFVRYTSFWDQLYLHKLVQVQIHIKFWKS